MPHIQPAICAAAHHVPSTARRWRRGNAVDAAGVLARLIDDAPGHLVKEEHRARLGPTPNRPVARRNSEDLLPARALAAEDALQLLAGLRIVDDDATVLVSSPNGGAHARGAANHALKRRVRSNLASAGTSDRGGRCPS